MTQEEKKKYIEEMAKLIVNFHDSIQSFAKSLSDNDLAELFNLYNNRNKNTSNPVDAWDYVAKRLNSEIHARKISKAAEEYFKENPNESCYFPYGKPEDDD